MSLKPITGSWRLSWTPRRTYKAPFPSDLKTITYDLLPSHHVTVQSMLQHIDESREWTDTAYLTFANGFAATWRMDGTILERPVLPDPPTSRPWKKPSTPIDIFVVYHRAVLQTVTGAPPPDDLREWIDKPIPLEIAATSQVIVLTDKSRVDRDKHGCLVMFSRDV